MQIFRATVLDTPGELAATAEGGLRSHTDCGLLVEQGRIVAREDFTTLRQAHPEAEVVELRDGLLLPGFVDTHVHYPQLRALGGLGMPLLEWLDSCALPEEVRLATPDYARDVAREFFGALIANGTTSALVFGSHHASAMDVFFTEAEESGLRITAGQVLSDRLLPEALLTDPAEAMREGLELIGTWHGRGRLRYAVTPRFSLSASNEMLAACRSLLDSQPDLFFTSHVNENEAEVARVAELFPEARDYVDTYERHQLLSGQAVLAHNVHPTAAELATLGARQTAIAHCPTSNASLGSGSFPMREHLDADVSIALGSDVGAGAGFAILEEARQAYFSQSLLGAAGTPLTPAQLLHLATRSGAQALGLDLEVGDLSVGKQFDAVYLHPAEGSTLGTVLRHANDASDALAKIMTLQQPTDIAEVWSAGQRLRSTTKAHTPAH